MLLSAVMCAKPLRHRNVNIKLYILKYTLILSPQFTKSKENKTSNQKEN
jgi:hypothetical protein